MKDTLCHLLQQKNVEFAQVNKELVLNACVHAHMGSDNGNCRPDKE
jgi:hypothetical protein